MGQNIEIMALSLDNPTYALLLKCGAVLGVNLILKAPLTGYYRVTRGAYLNREDAKNQLGNNEETIKKALAPNADVERVCRMHRNDLENIPIFLIMALLYVTTNPDPDVAKYHFYTFTASRLGFSLAYLTESRVRGLFFMGGLASLLSMTVRLLL